MNKLFILSKIVDYLKVKKIEFKYYGKLIMLQCIYCKKEPCSANIIPNTYRVNCLNCKKNYDLFDIVKEIDHKVDEKEVVQYLKKLLNLDITTELDEEKIEEALKFYEDNNFCLIALQKGQKEPIQGVSWKAKEYRKKEDWLQWIGNGLGVGVRTGECSGITIIDIDVLSSEEKNEIYLQTAKAERKQELFNKKSNNLLKIFNFLEINIKELLAQETLGGVHLFLQYVPEFPKTAITIEDIHIDVENNGGYVVVFPSKIGGQERTFNHFIKPTKINDKLKEKLLSYIGQRVETTEGEIIKKANLQIIPAGCRDVVLTQLGGVFRNQFNPIQTENILQILNVNCCHPKLDSQQVKKIVNSLEKYSTSDESVMIEQIYKYLLVAKTAYKADIEMYLFSNRAKGEDKKRMDKVLTDLIKDSKIVCKRKEYQLVVKADWKTSLINALQPIDFEMPYLNDVAHYHYAEMIMIGGTTGSGKCMRKGTKILMFDGTVKKIEDIVKGDQTMGVDSGSRTVLSVSQGKGMMYEIKPNKGESFVVNDKHQLSLKNTKTKNIINISIKDYLKQSKTFKHQYKLYKTSVEFKEKTLSLEPYFLGLWIGDGDKTNIRICNPDKEIINYIYDYAKRLDLKVSEYKYSEKSCGSYAIVRKNRKQKSFTNIFRKLGLLNNDKFIPKEYLINNRKNRLELLAGLLDSDGYYDRGCFEIISKYEGLKDSILFLVRSLGFCATCSIKKVKKYPTNIYYRIVISGFLENIPTKVIRKQASKRKINKDPLVTGFKIQKTGIGEYYGFMLNQDCLYLLDSFIVTHNSHLAMNMVQRLIQQGKKPYLIELEPNKKFLQVALQLGIKEGDFQYDFCDPSEVDLEPGAITIIDWILPKNYAETDKLFYAYNRQLLKTNGFLIVFVQLKEDGTWFASNLTHFFSSVSCKFLQEPDSKGEYSKFIINKVNDTKHPYIREIPCKYFWETKELKRIEDLNEKERNYK